MQHGTKDETTETPMDHRNGYDTYAGESGRFLIVLTLIVWFAPDATAGADSGGQQAPGTAEIPARTAGPGRADSEPTGDEEQAIEAFYQTPYADRWYGGAVVYEVMIRSFADSNGDGIGDIPGLIAHLDYLNSGDPATTTDLKVDALWLMPCFVSPSYHGYDATDYYQIDPVYGTMEDFSSLIREAHRRHIRILLDLVLNHTSNQHPWFQASASSPASPYRNWYVWSREKLDWHQPWSAYPVWHELDGWYYYGLFWAGMPDLNYREPAVREEMIAVGRFWLEHGVDGYRLDAIRYLYEAGKDRQADLPETHAYLKRFARAMRRVKPDVLLVGEVWADTSTVAAYYDDGRELDLAFGFDEAGAIQAGVYRNDPRPVADVLNRLNEHYPERMFSAPFLTNHDMVRLATALDSDVGKLKLAASVLLSLPGTPFLYQGEEIGLIQGSQPGDEGKRTPMQWDTTPNAGFTTAADPWTPLSGRQKTLSVAAQQGKKRSLLTHYQTHIRLRRASTALRAGRMTGVLTGEGKWRSVLSYERAVPGELMVCVFNFGTHRVPARDLPLSDEGRNTAGLQAPAHATLLQNGRTLPVSENSVRLPAMKGHTALWIQVTK